MLLGSILLLLPTCGTWDLEPNLVRADLPELPAEAELDYRSLPGMAHAALPIFDAERGAFTGGGRIWLKGSSACRHASISGTNGSVALDPPYYTAVVEAPAGERTVDFAEGSTRRSVRVSVPDAARLNAPGSAFSVLYFGDFQPFAIRDGRVRVNPGAAIDSVERGRAPETTLVALRKLLLAAAEGRIASFPKPLLGCGIGDQVYVEGDYNDYATYGQRHPMSAWTVEAQPRPRVSLAGLPRFLDLCYRGHWSFLPFERALQACPAVMMWDDHDIRDGWGSQGDEHVYRDSYFRVFREAFIDHQFRRGPRPWADDHARIDAPLWQSFAVGGVPMFMMDLRTCRDVAVPTVIGDEQWRTLRKWFADLDPRRCRQYVLVSTVPIFYRVDKRANIAAAFTDEVRDDLIDTWTSKQNEAEWLRLVAEIDKAGARGLRGVIISGDYHLNSLCRVTAGREGAESETIAYEMIASGLAANSYGDWKQKVARKDWFVATPIVLGARQLDTEFGLAESCPSFGGVEIAGDEVTASIFQARAEGCFQQRVPLSWSHGAEALRAVVARSRIAIDLERIDR